MARTTRRKVVVAPNVAETSITLAGVRLVIDGGQSLGKPFFAEPG